MLFELLLFLLQLSFLLQLLFQFFRFVGQLKRHLILSELYEQIKKHGAWTDFSVLKAREKLATIEDKLSNEFTYLEGCGEILINNNDIQITKLGISSVKVRSPR